MTLRELKRIYKDEFKLKRKQIDQLVKIGIELDLIRIEGKEFLFREGDEFLSEDDYLDLDLEEYELEQPNN